MRFSVHFFFSWRPTYLLTGVSVCTDLFGLFMLFFDVCCWASCHPETELSSVYLRIRFIHWHDTGKSQEFGGHWLWMVNYWSAAWALGRSICGFTRICSEYLAALGKCLIPVFFCIWLLLYLLIFRYGTEQVRTRRSSYAVGGTLKEARREMIVECWLGLAGLSAFLL